MAKSIITQDGDLVNYDNLVAISVEERAVGFDEEHSEDEYCIIGTDVKNGEILLYHSSDYEEVMKVQRDITRWLQSEAFSTFEMPTADEGGDALGEGGAKAKFRANVDAIKTLKTLERENRPATAEEKETLSKYVGWGALAKAFDKDDPKWAAEYKELSELLTPQEYAQARSTVNDAFYTSPTVIERQNGYKSVFK